MSDTTNGNTEPVQEVLGELRHRIDEVDSRLVAMLNERAQLVVEVGRCKRGSGTPIYAPHREAEVLNRVLQRNQGPLPDRTIEAVYRELMSGSFFLEQPLRIGYPGPKGSYGHVAAMQHFGSSVDHEDLRAIEGVFIEVARGHVDYGLVPIENSTGGGQLETMDALSRHHHLLNIYAEVQLEVNRSLLANCQPDRVACIYASRDSLAVCRNWLSTQYPNARLITSASSADAVLAAAEEAKQTPEAGVAAIGSQLAGKIHGLHCIFDNVSDQPTNITRFLILSRQQASPSGDDKTSVMFTTEDRHGALVDVLSVFDKAQINLTHIDKRPSGKMNWEYTFFIDAAGHRDHADFARAIDEARQHCKELIVIGSFPRSRRVL